MERPAKRIAPRIAGWVVFFAVVGAPAAYVYLYEPPIEVTVAPVQRGRVEQTVSAIASGTVRPARDSMIASGLIGTVKAVHVEEGDTVQEGDLLVELDHADLDAQVRLAEANLEAGNSALRQAERTAEIYEDIAETKVRLAQAQLDSAQQDYDRIKALMDRGGVSQSDLDKVALQLRVAQENAASALAGRRENEVRREQVSSARSNVRQLEAALEVARATKEKAFIRAPFGGIVAKINPDVGEAVGIGMPLVQLVQAGSFYVEAPFDEANSADIALGQTARINLDAYRGVDFTGEITFISPVVSLNPDLSRTRNVRIRIVEGQEKFVAGMSADVVILVDHRDDVVYAPSEAVVRERWAFVVENGRAARREIQRGLGNWRRTEVLAGLVEGDALITSIAVKGLEDGVKVRVVESLAE